MNNSEIIEAVKARFNELTNDIPLSDYAEVCSELADEFSVRSEAAEADLEGGQE